MQTILEDGLLKKIFDAAKDKVIHIGKEKDGSGNWVNKKDNIYLGGSISEYSKDLILTFPTLCDNSLTPATASMISKATERNVITMLEMLFASITIAGTNGKDIISKFHKNISIDTSMDEIIDALDSFPENADLTPKEREQIKLVENSIKNFVAKSFPTSSLNEISLNDYLVYNGYNGVIVKEAVDSKLKPSDLEYYEISNVANIGGNVSFHLKLKNGAPNNLPPTKNISKEVYDTLYSQLKGDEDYKLKMMDRGNTQAEFLKKTLLDSDVKKANELAPALMIVKYNVENPDQKTYSYTNSFVAGIKSRLISVDSMDIVDRIVAKNKTKLNFLNLIRATTGEISFIKDFIFCTKQAKIDAKNAVKKGPAAKIWNVLEYRGAKNSKHKLDRTGNDASAITTLVINQETVNILKKNYDFDLENINNTKMIIEAYNLLAIVICDESIEAAKFFYAGNELYETQAYSFLEKEEKDGSYKKVINLLNNSVGR